MSRKRQEFIYFKRDPQNVNTSRQTLLNKKHKSTYLIDSYYRRKFSKQAVTLWFRICNKHSPSVSVEVYLVYWTDAHNTQHNINKTKSVQLR